MNEIVRLSRPTSGIMEDLGTAAWFVWATALEKAGSRAERQQIDGIDGVLWRGSFYSIVKENWPNLEKDDQGPWKINQWLTETLNARCIRPKERPPQWWLRKEWNDQKPTSAGYTAVRSKPRASAGNENRPDPAPVETAFQCLACGERQASRDDLAGHARSCNGRAGAVESSRLASPRSFGEVIGHYRSRLGLSLARAAAAAGFTGAGNQKLAKIEDGGRNLLFEEAVQLSRALEFDLDELVQLVESPTCGTCRNQPPAGFSCNVCGRSG
ncbi:MAG: hypothetical protein ACRDG7_09985 [Candidatus Limnocylindria bacterium]